MRGAGAALVDVVVRGEEMGILWREELRGLVVGALELLLWEDKNAWESSSSRRRAIRVRRERSSSSSWSCIASAKSASSCSVFLVGGMLYSSSRDAEALLWLFDDPPRRE